MKKYKTDSPTYRHMKYFWKLLQKDKWSLELHWQYNRSYRRAMSQLEIVEDILSTDDTLKAHYYVYQNFLHAFQAKDKTACFQLIQNNLTTVNPLFQTVFQTFLRFRTGIENALDQPYSNGHLEALNNQLKTIKKLGYGYANFSHFKKRSLLILNH